MVIRTLNDSIAYTSSSGSTGGAKCSGSVPDSPRDTKATTAIQAPTAARIVLGLAFVVFGLNFFFGFIPQPEHPGEAGAFLGALFVTGYMFPLIKITEIVAGALLLTNRFVPLALLLLAPVLVNIVAFHAVLEPAGLGIGLALTALELGLAYAYRDNFKAVLQAKNEPRTAAAAPRRVAAHA